jgi:hypothetical protein
MLFGQYGVLGGYDMRLPIVANLWCIKTYLSDFVAKSPK